jgi:D-2-hydroxyacid dehydrogenase (NADP+)
MTRVKKTELLILLPHEKMRSKLQQLLAPRFPDVVLHATGDKAEALFLMPAVDVIVTFGSMLSPGLLGAASQLKWVHSLGTGVDGICDNPELAKHAMVTATRGIHGPVMAEMAFCMMLALSRDLPRNIRNQAKHEWSRWPAALLFNKKIGILGVGAIAQDIALRCKAFGMHVTGISRTPRELVNFDSMVGHDRMLEAVGEFDYLVLTIPYGPESHHMVNAQFLSRMKVSSFLVNIARGGVVDEDALLEALKSSQIAGAGLDVFSVEPLPATSGFWDLDNVITTAHQGGFSNTYIVDAFPCLEHNLKAFCNSDTSSMQNVVVS